MAINGLDAKKKCADDSNCSDKTPLTKKLLGVSRWLKLKSNSSNKNNAFKGNNRKTTTSFENNDCVIGQRAKVVRPSATKTEVTATNVSTQMRKLRQAKQNNIVDETSGKIEQLSLKSSFLIPPADQNAVKLRTLCVEHYTDVESSQSSKQSFLRNDVKHYPKTSSVTDPVETILQEPPLLAPVSGQLLTTEVR